MRCCSSLISIFAVVVIVSSAGCGRRDVHTAVENADIDGVMRYIKSGGDVNGRDGDGNTLLHNAVMSGYGPMVTLLLDSGADINARNRYGYTPLHRVCANSRLVGHIARVLIDRGADVNAKSLQGQTVLHMAVLGGDLSIVRLVLQKGGDVRAVDIGGWTPLHSAVEHHNAEVAMELVKADADVLANTRMASTPIDDAIMYKDMELAKMLVNAIDLNKGDEHGYTALHHAVRLGKVEMVKLLIERGVNVNQETKQGHTSLDFARYADSKSAVMADLLKAAGAGAGKAVPCDEDSKADFFGNVETVKKALASGKNIDDRDEGQQTFLHHACMKPDIEMCRFVLANGASVNLTDMAGLTPLHYASQSKNPAMVQALLDAGADPERDSRMGTPVHMALNLSDANSAAIFKLMVPNVKDWNRKSPLGDYTYIHSAVSSGQDEALKILNQHGADVNMRNKAGETPLHIAVRLARKTTVEILLQAGAEVNGKDGSDLTPLDRASSPHGSKEIADILREHGGITTVSWTESGP
jgi:ankyrin repeat protein